MHLISIKMQHINFIVQSSEKEKKRGTLYVLIGKLLQRDERGSV